jgi:microcystin-dependent protein
VNNSPNAFPPVGCMIMYGALTPPAGWLVCDGTYVSKTTYSALYSVIGDSFGLFQATLFNLPNLRQRFPVGTINGTSNGNVYNLGSIGGEEVHTLTVAEMPSHTHTYDRTAQSFGWNFNGGNGAGAQVPGSNNTGANGSSQAHNNTPLYTAVQFIIKY